MLKKVVLVTGLWRPEIGGPVLYAENLADYLIKRGADVRLVSPGCWGKSLPGPLRFVQYFFKILKNSFGQSIIYALDPWLCGLSSFWVSRLTGKKYLLRLGGDTVWERWVFENRQPLSLKEFYERGRYSRAKKFSTIKKIMRNAEKIIVPNRLLRDIYCQYYQVPETKIIIVPNPIPHIAQQPETAIKEQIIYAGRLINLKNLDLVIRSLPEIKERHPNLKFLIVGRGEEGAALINLVKSLNLEDDIQFIASLPQDRLFNHISQSKVCVLPSFSDCNPNFILECLALRKPVLITKENGLTIKLDAKFIFDYRNAQEFADKLDYLLTNYDAAQKEIERLDLSWSWDNWLEKNYQILHEVD